jgi:hypothetical protein
MRTFPLYCGINACDELTPIVPHFQKPYFVGFPIFEFCYFTFLFYCMFRSRALKVGLLLLFSGIVIYMWSYLTHLPASEHPDLMFVLRFFYCEALLLIPASFASLGEFIWRPPDGPLMKVPAFWLTLAIGIYFLVATPAFSYMVFAAVRKEGKLAATFFQAQNFIQVLTDSLFIIAMVCRKKKS